MKGLQHIRYIILAYQVLSTSVEQHVYAAISVTIDPTIIEPTTPPDSAVYKTVPTSDETNELVSQWTWKASDLGINSRFYQDRIRSLKSAIKEVNLDYHSTMIQGLDILKAHRSNYGSDGPKHLVVLWWEWPKQHWDDLRLGVSMNFMSTPTPDISANQDMNEPTLETAIQFVDELTSLKVLCIPHPSITVVNAFPFFLVIKPYQIGQYTTIADGKQGSQNDSCVADPCHITSPDHILPYLYKCGHSATLDLSKDFHIFLTKEEEHKIWV